MTPKIGVNTAVTNYIVVTDLVIMKSKKNKAVRKIRDIWMISAYVAGVGVFENLVFINVIKGVDSM